MLRRHVLAALTAAMGVVFESFPVEAAPSQTFPFTAQTVAPAKRQGAINVSGGVWRCQGLTCTRDGPASLLSVDVCKELVREVGALNAYSYPGKKLDADELRRCNESAAVGTPAPSQQVQFTAVTVAPAKRQGAVNVANGVWQCRQSTCTRTGLDSLLSVDVCKALAKEVGAVGSYGYPAKKLAPDELSKCNEGLVASGAPPAPPTPGSPAPGTPPAPDLSAPFRPVTVRTDTIRYAGSGVSVSFTPVTVRTDTIRFVGSGAAAAFTPVIVRTDPLTYVGRTSP
jgi:hypothetical protein